MPVSHGEHGAMVNEESIRVIVKLKPRRRRVVRHWLHAAQDEAPIYRCWLKELAHHIVAESVQVAPKQVAAGRDMHRLRRKLSSDRIGVAAEEVMAITGHRDYKSFQRYVKVTEQRKKTVMLKAWGGQIIKGKLKAI